MPAKKTKPRKTAKKKGGKLRGGVDPSVGKDTQFQPGESGNVKGRPPKTLITDAILDAAADNPELVKKIGVNLLKRAGKSDSSVVVVRDTVQGKPLQQVSGPEGGAIPLSLEGIDEALLKLFAGIQERQQPNK
jgi:hypothetical protein